MPAITFPANATGIVVNDSGQIYAQIPDQQAPQLLGQLSVANFANDSGLDPLGNNLYRETTASGQPVVSVAGDIGFGNIHQGYLEGSNVDPVKEITELISAQRAYEMNSKVIQAADEMASTVSKGIR
ncbi:MAG: flagellar basal-body rod protein FlgG, partial [Rhizobiales bacterium 35-66-30]